MSKIALTPNASGDGVFTITAPNSGTDRAIALPDAAGTIPLLAAASNTAITSTPAELNILDGVTSTAAELNILDGVTSTTAELNILDGVTSTAAELNILDGVTATAAELNLVDGGATVGTTALADGDGMLINDAGTMRMSTVQTVKTYMTAGVGASTDLSAVGTYALFFNTTTTTYNAGTTAAGSDLKFVNADKNGPPNTRSTGTWRCMGHSKGESQGAGAVTVWGRVS